MWHEYKCEVNDDVLAATAQEDLVRRKLADGAWKLPWKTATKVEELDAFLFFFLGTALLLSTPLTGYSSAPNQAPFTGIEATCKPELDHDRGI